MNHSNNRYVLTCDNLSVGYKDNTILRGLNFAFEAGQFISLLGANGADFNRHLGCIELRGKGHRGRAFVVAGMGSGVLLYRILVKRGFAVVTGVLHTNDLDYFVARSLGADCTAQAPMEAINDKSITAAAERRCGPAPSCPTGHGQFRPPVAATGHTPSGLHSGPGRRLDGPASRQPDGVSPQRGRGPERLAGHRLAHIETQKPAKHLWRLIAI